MTDLKLIALDADDLSVISAHMQDAVLTVGDLAYVAKDHRFVAIANRFDWMKALEQEGKATEEFQRRRAAVRFERVMGASVQDIDLASKERVLSLLAISFSPSNPPEGYVTLHFSEGGAVRLQVECIEAELTDLGAAWQSESKPLHPDVQKT